MGLMEENVEDIDLASYYLYRAIDDAQSLALQSTGSHSYVIDDVATITEDIGVYAEGMIRSKALVQGRTFTARYLNENIS